MRLDHWQQLRPGSSSTVCMDNTRRQPMIASPLRSKHSADRPLRLRHIVEHAAHLLPAQGPIGVFIHQNTLHAFQHLPFEDAVVAASGVYGTEPFMSEAAYRENLAKGRIRGEDLRAVVNREANGAILPGFLDRRALRNTLLLNGQSEFDPATIDWMLEETNLLEPDGHRLFAACLELVQPAGAPARPPARPQEGLLRIAGIDLDEVIHPLLIRLTAVFLDQGMAYWPMPNRQSGFLNSIRILMAQGWTIFPEYLERLGHEFRDQLDRNLGAEDVVINLLDQFGVPEEDWESVVQAELLALPGWAGILHQLEENPALAPHVRVPCSLIEFLAVRLTLELVAAVSVLERRGIGAPGLQEWRETHASVSPIPAQRRANAAGLWDALRRLGLSEQDFAAWNPVLQRRLVNEIQTFDQLERRRLFHLAYELRHEQDVLQALSLHRKNQAPSDRNSRPSAEVFFCIDEREESMRRHLEEVAPDVKTHGTAGFFGVAMYYAGIDDAHAAALCPVVIKPQHSVRERPVSQHSHLHERRIRRRRTWARLARHTFVSSRTLLRGWVSTTALWPLSLVPLVTRVLAPGRYGRLEKALHRSLIPQPSTELAFARSETETDTPSSGLLPGFALQEMIDRVAGTLGNAGVRDRFARLVVILGHGSTSLNNPHESAHDCGACGGGRGGPNGRVFAAMANCPEVREGLRARGIDIPGDTWFVGGYHDTCNADITLFDVERVPEGHRAELSRLRAVLDTARALDAQERVRRFEAASAHGGPRRALRHVQDRAERLSEPRPEYGHATNAVCIVGRRELTRSLFLDRRAFLVSYDAALDTGDDALARLLGAVVPVCAGISLEYYFSFVDNERYGCGTKLPHNVTGLIGVMNGHASDLRTGLPWQMVEVHEPVRILFVVETTPERVMKVMSANPGLSEFLENQWIRLATIHPDTGEVRIRRGQIFEKLSPTLEALPCAPSSADWFRGKIEHLPIAQISPAARL